MGQKRNIKLIWFDPYQSQFPQHISFPALCTKSRGSSRLAGTSDKNRDNNMSLFPVSPICSKTHKAGVNRLPPDLNNSIPTMAIIEQNDLSFDWSTHHRVPLSSLGPGRIRTRRTRRLQRETTIKSKARTQMEIVMRPDNSIDIRLAAGKHSIQTKPVATFLILVPFVFFRPS